MATPVATPQAPPSTLLQRFFGRLPLTARPVTPWQQFVNSAAVWLVLMAYWGLADVIITLHPVTGRPIKADSWTVHAGFTVAGLIGIWFSHQTGFPAAWDARISRFRRFLLPALLGLGFGLLSVVIDLVTGASKILTGVLGQPFNVDFPGSLLTDSSAAIYLELIFRLLAVPLLLWLISTVLLKQRGQAQVFWGLALLTSLIEPGVVQGVPLLVLSHGLISYGVFAAYFVEAYAMNFTQAVFFRRYGFLAAIVVRLADYLMWHIIYGNFLFGYFFP